MSEISTPNMRLYYQGNGSIVEVVLYVKRGAEPGKPEGVHSAAEIEIRTGLSEVLQKMQPARGADRILKQRGGLYRLTWLIPGLSGKSGEDIIIFIEEKQGLRP